MYVRCTVYDVQCVMRMRSDTSSYVMLRNTSLTSRYTLGAEGGGGHASSIYKSYN